MLPATEVRRLGVGEEQVGVVRLAVAVAVAAAAPVDRGPAVAAVVAHFPRLDRVLAHVAEPLHRYFTTGRGRRLG